MTDKTERSETMLPCPFCGEKVYGYETGYGYRIPCSDCDYGIERHSKAEAIKAWNTRPDAKDTAAEVEGLRNYKKEFNPEFIASLEGEITKWWETAMKRRDELATANKMLRGILKGDKPIQDYYSKIDNYLNKGE